MRNANPMVNYQLCAMYNPMISLNYANPGKQAEAEIGSTVFLVTHNIKSALMTFGKYQNSLKWQIGPQLQTMLMILLVRCNHGNECKSVHGIQDKVPEYLRYAGAYVPKVQSIKISSELKKGNRSSSATGVIYALLGSSIMETNAVRPNEF